MMDSEEENLDMVGAYGEEVISQEAMDLNMDEELTIFV